MGKPLRVQGSAAAEFRLRVEAGSGVSTKARGQVTQTTVAGLAGRARPAHVSDEDESRGTGKHFVADPSPGPLTQIRLSRSPAASVTVHGCHEHRSTISVQPASPTRRRARF